MSVPSEDFLSTWQHLYIRERTLEDDRVSERANSLRNLLLQLQYARQSKILSHSASSQLFLHQADTYGSMVDMSVDQNGLDNFAEAALSLADEKSNDSQNWQSSLSVDFVSKLPFVQDLFSASEAARENHLPKDCFQVPVKQIQSENQHSSYQKGTFRLQTETQQPKYLQTEPTRKQSEDRAFWNMNSLETSKPTGNLRREELDHGVQRRSMGKRPRANNNRTDEEENSDSTHSVFRTAKEQLIIDQTKQNRRGAAQPTVPYGNSKKSLGTRRGLNSKFVPPVLHKDEEMEEDNSLMKRVTSAVLGGKTSSRGGEEILDERLKNVEPKMVELIMNEIMDLGPLLTWNDIAGLEFAKKTIKEIVVWPMLRPDIFTGLRGPPKGLLLFGPPGTGKTLIGKCIASQSKSTFFSISASSLTSKWVGEGEKMVRALFTVARVHQPAVIFIDEIDSLLSQRSDGEHEASRRIKTEFLVQLDGTTTGAEDKVLVVGATNRPQEIDEAARRRFVKRLYIPLPEALARKQIVTNLMAEQSNCLTEDDLEKIYCTSKGYSGSDMANLCREAALGPIRSMPFGDIENITVDQVRPIAYHDFEDAFKQVRASVSQQDLCCYLDWNKQYGSWGVV